MHVANEVEFVPNCTVINACEIKSKWLKVAG